MRSPGIIGAVVLGLTASFASAQQAPQSMPAAVSGGSTFTIFLRSTPVGRERIAVEHNAGGWTITSSGQTGAPVDLVARLVQVRYTDDWKPLELSIDGVL